LKALSFIDFDVDIKVENAAMFPCSANFYKPGIGVVASIGVVAARCGDSVCAALLLTKRFALVGATKDS
jgi:hypothetical protein